MACLTLFFFSSSVDSPINDDKVNEVKAEVSELENNANDRKKNDIADVRENYKFDVSLSFVYTHYRYLEEYTLQKNQKFVA